MVPIRTLSATVAVLAFAAHASAQASFQIPLTYNFNGIVHAGESNLPDDLNGFRSISDRALDFQAGVPSDSLLDSYTLVATPNTLDLVHLGNRNTVDFGNRPFDLTPNGDDFGVQPAWLPSPDQSTPQVSDFNLSPIPIDSPSSVSFLIQISNGGGSFDVTFGFLSGATQTETISGPDWFGGAYAGTGATDSGVPDANLSITEVTVDISGNIGDLLTSVTFSNASNANAGYAVLAGRVDSDATPAPVNPIQLNYNFNGLVHAGESGVPDDLLGFRSISDRALDFTAGVPSDALLDRYAVINTPGVLDIVHLGNRNTVDLGNRPFDATPDGDDFGVQPTWLGSPDQTGPQATVLSAPISLVGNSEAGLIFQISNGGGSFDVTLAFQSGAATTATLSGGDWFGGVYAGTDATDNGNPGANLSIVERSIDLSAHAGELVTSVVFSNGTNPNAGIAILAMNISGCPVQGGTSNLGGGNGPTISSTATGQLGAPVDAIVAGAGASTVGSMLIGVSTAPIPLSLVFGACTAGDLVVSSPIATVPAQTSPTGGYTLTLNGPNDPGFCGNTFYFQYGELSLSTACPIVLSDTLGVTFGY